MSSPEGRVKQQIQRRLKERGIWYFMPVSNGMGARGIPDFICCWDGRFLGIEAKAAGKRDQTTAHQKRTLAGIQEHGGLSIVVDDVTQLEKLLDAKPIEATLCRAYPA